MSKKSISIIFLKVFILAVVVSNNSRTVQGQIVSDHEILPQNEITIDFEPVEIKESDIKKTQDNTKKAFIKSYEQKYHDFIKNLNLTDEEKEEVAFLIARLDTPSLGELLSKEDLIEDENSKSRYEVLGIIDNKLRDLLGDNNYSGFKNFTESIKERTLFNDFIKSANIDIQDETKEEVIHSMYEARKKFISNTPNSAYRQRPNSIPEPAYKNYLIYQSYLESLKDILSDSEIEMFKKYTEQKYADEIKVFKGM